MLLEIAPTADRVTTVAEKERGNGAMQYLRAARSMVLRQHEFHGTATIGSFHLSLLEWPHGGST